MISIMDYIDRNHRALLEFMVLSSKIFDNFALPIKPNKDYDLIGISSGEEIKFSGIKIICTETKQASGAYVANLLRSGGYESKKEKKVHFQSSSCDFVFVWTPEKKYLIPSESITQTRAITLSVFNEFIIAP